MLRETATALYYTFSTIAQALAGTVALLAAFVLYKLTDMDRERAKHGDALIQRLGDQTYNAVVSHYAHGRFEEFTQAIRQREEINAWQMPEHYQLYMRVERIEALSADRKALLSRIRPAVWWSLGTMLISVMVLASVPQILTLFWLPLLTLLAGVVTFGICIYRYLRLIGALLK
jgi:hypothetical protein